jgi:geranylgeranyl pyrophosphate synthase
MDTSTAIDNQVSKKAAQSRDQLFFVKIDTVSQEIMHCRSHLEEPLRSAFDHHFKKCGKLLRANLALRAAQASGLGPQSCVRWAASVELLHNASLVHDDVCDDDSDRRGITSVSEMYGKEIAICLGDAMIALSSLLLAQDYALQHTLPAHNLAILKLSAGQAAEFSTLSYPTLAAYEKLVEGKTTPLISLPLLGLNPTGQNSSESHLIAQYFSATSIAFQIMNDIQNIEQGKQLSSPPSDLQELRPNAVIAKFYESLPELDKRLFTRSKNGKTFTKNDTRLNFWWEQILLSDSLATTRQLLGDKLNRSQKIFNSLSNKSKDILQPFDHWLRKSYSNLSPH